MKVWYIIFIGLFCAMLLFIIYNTYKARKTRDEWRAQEKKRKEAEHAQAKRQTEAAKTKQDAKTGNPRRDSDYMANKLHEFANK